MAKKRSRINLNILISQTNQPKFYIKILQWMLSTGKFFVVAVEMVVVAGFVYRYSLDARLQDLKDEINQQVPFLKSLQKDELTIRQTQQQLTTIRSTRINDVDYAILLRTIASLTPSNVHLINITIDKTLTPGKTALRIIGSASNNYEVSYFVKQLQKDPQFSDIVLGNVSFEKQLISFSISGSIAPKKPLKSS